MIINNQSENYLSKDEYWYYNIIDRSINKSTAYDKKYLI